MESPDLHKLLLTFGDKLPMKEAIKTSNIMQLMKKGYTFKEAELKAKEKNITVLQNLSVNMLAFECEYKNIWKALNNLIK